MFNPQDIAKELVEELSNLNTSPQAFHPQDESKAKELLKALHKAGARLDESLIEQEATKAGWNKKLAKKLGEYAGKIASGGRVVIKFPSDYDYGGQRAADIIARLKN